MATAKNRILLKKGDVLRLCREPAPGPAGEWRITGYVGEGGSAVCYSAAHQGKTGRLKEFYPADTTLGTQEYFFFLTRTPRRQLVPVGEGMRRRFEAMCDDFVAAYRALDAARAADASNRLLNNYIPPCEVLYGFAEDGARASCYIWTPDDRTGQSFDSYLREVRRRPGRLPEHKLYNIFCTLITLTDCVRLLHRAGLLHLDIKPANFLVTYDSDFNINPGSISLFDVSTVYPMDSRYPRLAGTPGFQAPEVRRGRAENRSDLYSLGAVLFYAAVVTDDPADGLYRDALYPRLEQLVADSRLIRASDTNANVFVRYQLTRVLQKCLAPRPADRYGSCEELKAGLEQLRAFLLPQVESGKLGPGRRLAILDTERADRVSPGAVIHDLLFRDPLYARLAPGAQALHVLAVGAGTYGQKFMDICLQAGQMRGCRLHVTALSEDPELDRRVYLQVRPALPRFVRVGGCPVTDDTWAELDFWGMPGAPFRKGSPQENRAAAAAVLDAPGAGGPFGYLFVALGDDALNAEVADAFADEAEAQGLCCAIHYAVRGRALARTAQPVYISAPVTADTIDPRLERMAFNTHLCWNGGAESDMSRARRQFREPYNHLSSLSYALSIPYKLHGAGIDPGDPGEAAAVFFRRFADSPCPADAAVLNELVALEHRRWVLEKVCDGWDAPRTADGSMDVEGCVRRGSVKSKAQKLHPCIVKSRPGSPLQGYFYREQPDRWNTPQPGEESLDELDQLSLALHRCFFRHAQAFRRQAPLQQGDLALIRQQLLREPAAVAEAFSRYELCLQNVLNGSRHYTGRYAFYEAGLRSSLQQASPAVRADVSLRLDALQRALFPVLESNLCRNYKAYDEVLVRQIPFILTHGPQPALAMLFDDAAGQSGRSAALFRNAASAAALCPARLTYLYHCGPNADSRCLEESLRAVLRYLDARGLSCRVSFALVAAEAVWQKKGPAFRACLDAVQKTTRLHDFTVLTCPDERSAVPTALRWLRQRRIDLFDCSPRAVREPLWDGPLYIGARSRWPGFEFDVSRRAFMACSGCLELLYRPDPSFLRVEDLFTLGGASDVGRPFPEFAGDLPALWRIYTGKSDPAGGATFDEAIRAWGRLCGLLARHTAACDVLAELPLDGARQDAVRELVCFFPPLWFGGVQELLRQLIACGAVGADSSLCSYTSDTCRAVIRTSPALAPALDRLFGTPDLLADGRGLRVTVEERTGGPCAVVRCSSLLVQDLPLADAGCLAVLEQLQAQHFIRGLCRSGGRVRFLFSSRRIRGLLTDAAEMPTLALFYELGRLGCFDDIACGCRAADGAADLVATRGFCSLFVSCGRAGAADALTRLAVRFGVQPRQAQILVPGQTDAAGPGCFTLSAPGDLHRIGLVLQRLLSEGAAGL